MVFKLDTTEKRGQLVGIDKYTKDTVKYSALTKDRHKVIYCASVQLADNLDNQSHNLHLPDWDRNRENRDYHWKMGSRK